MYEELEIAKQAALSAGALILSHLHSQHAVEQKTGFDFVTEVDRLSEELIRGIIHKAFPDHGFFCEEQVSCANQSEEELLSGMRGSTWVIDALDGTTNFIRGIPQFAVSIALVRDGALEVGVVYDPSRGELFAAQRGRGATMNGEPIHVSRTEQLTQSILAYGFPAADLEKRAHTMETVKKLAMRVGSMRIYNCAALLLCYVACGRLDLSWEEGLHLWDMAAGVLLVREAGGVVSRADGAFFDLASRENLAGNPALHNAFLQISLHE